MSKKADIPAIIKAAQLAFARQEAEQAEADEQHD